MSAEQVVRSLSGRLSLRAPQRESLEQLARAIAVAPDTLAHGERDLPALLAQMQAAFPLLKDFDREFPSLCFALATGVGKTRLMGAFISYLYLAHGIQNFFVMAPNLTIYNKLIADFTPNTPKYVFKGVAEFAVSPPEIITGDNYEQRGANLQGGLLSPVTINIFNISKINSEVRGGKSPRIKRLSEYIGQSYFDYLAALPDLVLLMDESHRYRASAGVRAINELKPILGLELTATPFVESAKGPVPFRNVVVDYPLARALDDGFVKSPAVVTQRNFNPAQYPADALERIKLQDGVRLHEATKVELTTYAHQNGVRLVKPFMLVIARDTTHAGQLLDLIQSAEFFEGRYRDKVIQVDSSKSGVDEEQMVSRLLAVESVDEPTEIVIHVNMLKEGWDVTNLYTIVPLRAANARTLIEQSIGRGLRLPYGQRTGVAAVDRLNIVAHDRFQEIVDEANRPDSTIRLQQLILDAPEDDARKVSIDVPSLADVELGLAVLPGVPGMEIRQPVYTTSREMEVVRLARQVAASYEIRRDLAPTSGALLNAPIQAEIVAAVRQQMAPAQGDLLPEETPVDVAAIVAQTIQSVVERSIDIPRIVVVPTGEVVGGFRPFSLDTRGFASLQPGERDILIQNLHNHAQETLAAQAGIVEQRPEDYIVHGLMDFDDIDYDSHAELLYDLAGQAVAALREKLASDDELRNVLDGYRRLISDNIHAQMLDHFDEGSVGYVAEVKRGFTAIKSCSYSATAGEIHYFRDTVAEIGKIKQMLFGGFEKCLYPLQKFDSDTERRFAVILEREAAKWFKPAKGQFQIFYRLGAEQPEYVPDFVAETANEILMCETKARGDLASEEVLAKAAAAARWCAHASDYGKAVGGKPWRYLLIPHDEVADNRTLAYLSRFSVE
ncbi:DEAD/DEAH box helicase family protein [Dechloromonas sp. ARDL1]|uniref:DEAD/DEAH box helicase n=1 Tax=Dechloromonas sp. ARDL1 TaxID=3322121 RepID=UPI003DA6DDBC